MRSIALTALFLFSAACGTRDGEAPVAKDDSVAAGGPEAQRSAAAPAVSTDTPWVMRMDGMGPLRVGMTFDQARTALGGELAMDPDSPIREEGPDRCDYPRSGRLPAGVLVMVEGQRVVRVEVDSGTMATAEGARIGDAEARIQQLYPGRVTVEPHKYTDGHYLVVRPAAASDTTNLLVFETDGRVVERFRAGRKPQVQWVEGCS